MRKKTKLPCLPHELIIQILLKLPVKFLIRFKCVCKSWFSLISDSHFANSHFQLTATNIPKILGISVSPPEFLSIDFENHVSASLNLNFSLPQSYFPFQIKDSCRGFLFLHFDFSRNYLWNPSTRFHKQIPVSPIHSNLEAYYLFGFGYDKSRDDYLVVLISTLSDNSSSYLEFFSLRDNTWKQIEGDRFPYMDASSDRTLGLFFTGAIHWLAYHHDLSVDVIVAFDLTERKLLEMPLPDGDFVHVPINCDLWVSGEFLSLSAIDYVSDTIELWVMKEYKVNSSWTKTLVIHIDNVAYFSPMYFAKNGDIIGTNGGNVVKYNYKGQLLDHRSYSDDPDGSQVVMYTESLLSLPGGAEQV
jgi:F-box interacting protein